ncbi:uncharacterized protein C6G9.01c-like [Chenopodium quinoa]|uniref:uncharacterized protein C6G9.01c-like n=1 Tax=Chenopodium quinoa TaxID=63459 RepID=UPI000B787690|nr:uncharacterized protein C6G9.01c-like [Chenopodium quinoa]XP_021730125.1 uncharacterized protein C6G9.01c-like [Chenopodium quinoa]
MPKKKSSKVSNTPKEEPDTQLVKLSGNSKKANESDMPKKKSSKASNAPKELDAQQEKPSAGLKKADEIDIIFASRKRKKAEQGKAERTSNTNEKSKKIKKKMKRSLKENEALNPDSKPRRRTNDGLAIYSEEELRLNSQDGGNTGECPFDCSCCF